MKERDHSHNLKYLRYHLSPLWIIALSLLLLVLLFAFFLRDFQIFTTNYQNLDFSPSMITPPPVEQPSGTSPPGSNIVPQEQFNKCCICEYLVDPSDPSIEKMTRSACIKWLAENQCDIPRFLPVTIKQIAELDCPASFSLPANSCKSVLYNYFGHSSGELAPPFILRVSKICFANSCGVDGTITGCSTFEDPAAAQDFLNQLLTITNPPGSICITGNQCTIGGTYIPDVWEEPFCRSTFSECTITLGGVPDFADCNFGETCVDVGTTALCKNSNDLPVQKTCCENYVTNPPTGTWVEGTSC